MVTSMSVLAITCLSFVIYEYNSFRKTTIGNLHTLGALIADNCSDPLAFSDNFDADEILSSLRVEEHIISARLYDRNGYLFAQYPTDFLRDGKRFTRRIPGHVFSENYLESFHPVEMDHVFLGTLILQSDLKAMDKRFQIYGIVVALVILVAFFFASYLSRVLQRDISRPLINLAETAQTVSIRRDYTVRALQAEKFEIGELTEAFNHMLEQIENRDEALKDFNKNLEDTVIERTAELLEAETQLLKLNGELEERVLERTNELQESQVLLLAKNDELERTNVDLDNFVYRASHDLKAPISNIEGLTLLLQGQLEDRLEPDEKKLLDMIELSLNKLKTTIIDLTEISKVQKDQEFLEESISFDEIVKEVTDDLWQLIAEAGAEINTNFQVPNIMYAYTNLRSILYNLISNAIKYKHPDRLPEIYITSTLHDGRVVLSVTDNGLGISHADYDKIFTMFKRLHAHVEGSGIGLYITRRIVENCRGKITVESEPGLGTTFKVFF